MKSGRKGVRLRYRKKEDCHNFITSALRNCNSILIFGVVDNVHIDEYASTGVRLS